MSWLPIAISAIALVCVTNVAEKYLVEKRIKNATVISILYGLATLAFAIVLLCIKGLVGVSIVQLFFILLSGALLAWYLIPYFKALSYDDASRVIPIFQSIPIFVLGFSFVFLHETLTAKQLIGFFIIIVGALILGTERIENKVFRPRKSLWLMLLSSAMYAMSAVLFKGVVNHLDFWSSFIYQSLGVGLGTGILLLFPKNLKQMKKDMPRVHFSTLLIIVGTHGIGFVSELLSFFAVSLAPVALVSVVGGLQPFFLLMYILILSFVFPKIIHEKFTKASLISKMLISLLLFLGIYLINI